MTPQCFTVRDTCRACGAKSLEQILDLGRTALANAFMTRTESLRNEYFPTLRLNLCTQCSLVQLREVVDPKILYSNYAYVTSNSETMKEHLMLQRETLIRLCGKKFPSVLEIGSNNGENLKLYKDVQCEVIGVDPAANLAAIAEEDGIPTYARVFDSVCVEKLKRYDLVIARHVFGHIDNWREFFELLASVTHEDSTVAIEVPYMRDFFEKRQWDTIYHEHLSYVSVSAIFAALKDTPFGIRYVQHVPIHCGSIVVVLHRNRGKYLYTDGGVYLHKERKLNLNNPETWIPFAAEVATVRRELRQRILEWRREGKRVAAYGASAKASTLFNVCQIGTDSIDYVVDNTPFKQGKVCPGSLIPVMPPEHFRADKPDVTLVTAWNFYDEIVRNEAGYEGEFVNPHSIAKPVCATLTQA